MIEQVFQLSTTDERTVEKILYDENVHYLHMVFNRGEGLPLHYSDSNVYMTVLRGTLSIGLDDQEIHTYPGSTMLKIPYQTRMNVSNQDDATLELIVVKTPAPRS
ncbi:MAG: hypothetical protein GXY52_05470 [Chloroflexi bacterium]|nr:hypothetical protein [Chloroflexota bacterium]